LKLIFNANVQFDVFQRPSGMTGDGDQMSLQRNNFFESFEEKKGGLERRGILPLQPITTLPLIDRE